MHSVLEFDIGHEVSRSGDRPWTELEHRLKRIASEALAGTEWAAVHASPGGFFYHIRLKPRETL
ncbi:MAG: hypothetical protein V1708_05535 [Candidatus Micrarchaeota archaeon]